MLIYRFPGRDHLLVCRQYSYAAASVHFAYSSNELDFLKNLSSTVEQTWVARAAWVSSSSLVRISRNLSSMAVENTAFAGPRNTLAWEGLSLAREYVSSRLHYTLWTLPTSGSLMASDLRRSGQKAVEKKRVCSLHLLNHLVHCQSNV
jgi:hypothetical protein